MVYEKLVELIKSDFDKAIPVLEAKKKEKVAEYVDEYKGSRNIGNRNQVGKRQSKKVGESKTVEVAKIPFQYQKKIVRSAAAFLFGSAVKLASENEGALIAVKSVWEDNKIDSLLQKFCEAVKSQTEAVFFFFPQDNTSDDGGSKKKVKIRLYDSSNGSYAPTFDEFGDMIAFVWSFSSVNEEGKKQENKWVFTKEFTYKKHKGSDGWVDTVPAEPNLFKKIPVVYLSQEEPEWFDVKELIDRYEMNFSKFCDTNDYFASPMLKMFGKVESMPNKEDQGKAVKIPKVFKEGKDMTGDVGYLTWQHAPEAIRLEAEISDNMIHNLTDTPDLSLRTLMGAGNVASGTAAKFMFMAPILKAKWSEGDYSTAIGRVISLIVQGITGVSVDASESVFTDFKASVEFTSILPDNIVEIVSMLSEAAGGKVFISQETAAEKSGLVKNASDEMLKIKKEEAGALGDVVQES